MVRIVDVSSTSLVPFFDGWRRVRAYGKRRGDVEQWFRAYVHTIADESGVSLSPINKMLQAMWVVVRQIRLLWVPLAIATIFAALVSRDEWIRKVTEAGDAIVQQALPMMLAFAGLFAAATIRVKKASATIDVVSARNTAKGRRALAIARTLNVIGFVIVALGFLYPAYLGKGADWKLLAPGFGISLLGSWLSRRASQLLQPSADELLKDDTRPPIIWLRSFQDEQLALPSKNRPSRWRWGRLEPVVTLQLQELGPLIAIGKPGEALPELGAARNYYADSEWQDIVKTWLNNARIVSVILGLTPGLRWELEQIKSAGFLKKVLMIVPGEYQADRWALFRDAFLAVPGFSELPEFSPEGLRVVYVSSDDQPTLVCAKGCRAEDYQRAIRFAVYGMFSSTHALDPQQPRPLAITNS